MTLLSRTGLAGVLAAWALMVPAGAQTAQDTPDNATAYTALRVVSKNLGRDALDRVVEVVGKDGAPQPSLWKIVLKEGTGSRELDVENGNITAQRPLTRPPAYSTAIKLSDLNLDSSGAFDATDAQARKVKLRFDSLNYVLRMNENTGKPFWQIELINKEGAGVGTIRVAAHDGTVISTDGRLASNPPTSSPAVATSTPRPTPKPVVISTPPPRVVTATPSPASTPRHIASTTTTTTTVERTAPPVVQSETVMTDRDNVYVPPQPPVQEEGGLFTRAGRTLDKTNQRVESTLRNAGSKVQRFFTFRRDGDQDSRPEQEVPSNRPD